MCYLTANSSSADSELENYPNAESGELPMGRASKKKLLSMASEEEGMKVHSKKSVSTPIAEVDLQRKSFLFQERAEIAHTQLNTERAEAVKKNLEKKIEVERTADKATNVRLILAADESGLKSELTQKQMILAKATNDLMVEKERGETELLKQKAKTRKAELKLAEVEAKLDRIRNSPPRKTRI